MSELEPTDQNEQEKPKTVNEIVDGYLGKLAGFSDDEGTIIGLGTFGISIGARVGSLKSHLSEILRQVSDGEMTEEQGQEQLWQGKVLVADKDQIQDIKPILSRLVELGGQTVDLAEKTQDQKNNLESSHDSIGEA